MATSKTSQILRISLVAILCTPGMMFAFGPAQIGRVGLTQLSFDDAELAPEPAVDAVGDLEAAGEEDPFVVSTPDDLPSASPSDGSPPASAEFDPSPKDDAGGWQQAGDGDDELDSTLRRHILFISPEGVARGRISLINPVTHLLVPASDVKLTFLTPEGATAFESIVQTNGAFELSNIPEGVFAVIASGPTAFMAFAVQTIRAEGVPLTAADWSFDGAAVPQRDFPALTDILSTLAARDSHLPMMLEPSPEQIPGEAGPRGGWTPDEGIDTSRLATPIRNHEVYLQEDGRVLGRLRRLHPVTGRPLVAKHLRVHAVRDGQIVESTATSELGTFDLHHLTPAVYSLIAEGPDGFMAFAVDVRRRDERVAESEKDDTVAVFTNFGLEVDAATVPSGLVGKVMGLQQQAPQDQGALAGVTEPVAVESAPVETGSGGGGGISSGGTGTGGGGAGFGGGSGLLEALAGAGLIAGAAALINDSGDKDPVSPASF